MKSISISDISIVLIDFYNYSVKINIIKNFKNFQKNQMNIKKRNIDKINIAEIMSLHF